MKYVKPKLTGLRLPIQVQAQSGTFSNNNYTTIKIEQNHPQKSRIENQDHMIFVPINLREYSQPLVHLQIDAVLFDQIHR